MISPISCLQLGAQASKSSRDRKGSPWDKVTGPHKAEGIFPLSARLSSKQGIPWCSHPKQAERQYIDFLSSPFNTQNNWSKFLLPCSNSLLLHILFLPARTNRLSKNGDSIEMWGYKNNSEDDFAYLPNRFARKRFSELPNWLQSFCGESLKASGAMLCSWLKFF